MADHAAEAFAQTFWEARSLWVNGRANEAKALILTGAETAREQSRLDIVEAADAIVLAVNQDPRAEFNLRDLLARLSKDFKHLIQWAIATLAFCKGEYSNAVRTMTEVIQSGATTPEKRLQALFFRGVARSRASNMWNAFEAIFDYDSIIDSSEATTALRAKALNNRAVLRGHTNDYSKELEDYERVITMSGVPTEQVALARLNRGRARALRGDRQSARDDFTALIDLPDVPPDLRVEALLDRGIARRHLEDVDGSILDLVTLIRSNDGLPKVRITAHINCGVAHELRGDLGKAQEYLEEANRLSILEGEMELAERARSLLSRVRGASDEHEA
ncbi:MAG: tetratricopeptide repeat protein, partial [Thermomicrobiales bacterium]